MSWLTGAVAWIYDFLAEDMVVLAGGIIAALITVAAVHSIRTAAGVILFVVVAITIALSLWRTVSAS